MARLADTRPVQPVIERILWRGKTTQLLGGVDVRGKPFAKLAPSTLKVRKGWAAALAEARRVAADQAVYAVT